MTHKLALCISCNSIFIITKRGATPPVVSHVPVNQGQRYYLDMTTLTTALQDNSFIDFSTPEHLFMFPLLVMKVAKEIYVIFELHSVANLSSNKPCVHASINYTHLIKQQQHMDKADCFGKITLHDRQIFLKCISRFGILWVLVIY